MELKKLRVVFMGTPIFARTILERLTINTDVVLVVSQPDAPVGRKKIMTPSPVKEYALNHDIECFTPNKIKDDYQRIIDAQPDIIITCAYGQIIPEFLLNLPKFGAINVHASLLPKLRGGAPIHRAIMEGHDKTGITIMYMDKHMDSGDIISMEETLINIDDTLETLSKRLQNIGARLLLETLPKILDGTNDRIPQNDNDVTYAPIIKKEDEHIDFSKSSKEIYDKIRALNPNPGAYFLLDNEVIKVYESRVGESNSKQGVISNIYKDGIGIGTSDKEIIITKIKPAGKNIIPVRDYLNGIKKESILGKKCE